MTTQDYWDKQHDKYLAFDWIDKPSLFAEWSMTYLPKAGALLDLGAGQAQDSRYFADRGFKVTATDFSPHALELAQGTSSQIADFKIVDLAKPLPFTTESFDVVYAHLSLHYFDASTTVQLFSEIERVLKPGGIFAALCNTTEDPEIADAEKIEDDYYLIDGIAKRYFNPASMRDFARSFEILLADAEGSTYKDIDKGVHNLIRLVAQKK